jgi:UDP-3-O-[3-hydroxymyristoyl] N-acetylglucosamine deacetylase
VRVGSAAAWVEASPSLDGQMHLQYSLDYGPEHPVPPQQFACSLSPELFTRGLAPARTFVTAEQVEQLRRAGVGGHVTPRDLLVFDESGPIANLLRFTDECARHKVLDLVGDLALSGAELVGKFVSYRGGHQLNGAMVRQLCRMAASQGMGCRRAA